MCACSFIMIAMTLFPLLYIYLRWSEVGITFSCLVFTIERHLEACAFLPRRFSYLHSLIRFFPILITLYSQKINNLNEQKYFSLNLSFLMIWYIQGLPLRKLIQKKFVVCFFFFLKLIWTMCRNCFRKLVTWNVIQFIMTGVGDQRYLVNSGMIRSFWWILSALL